MQYWQRKLQRSVTETRRSEIGRPCPSRSRSDAMRQGYSRVLRPILACALAIALATALAGCGESTSEESRVRDTLDRLAKATAQRDYQMLCDDILSASLVNQVETAGVPCRDALRAGLGGVRRPRLKVVRVRVRGKRATATVHTSATGQKPSDDTVVLAKEGSAWRVLSLSNSAAR